MHSVRRVVDFVRARKGQEDLNFARFPSLSIVADDEQDGGDDNDDLAIQDEKKLGKILSEEVRQNLVACDWGTHLLFD